MITKCVVPMQKILVANWISIKKLYITEILPLFFHVNLPLNVIKNAETRPNRMSILWAKNNSILESRLFTSFKHFSSSSSRLTNQPLIFLIGLQAFEIENFQESFKFFSRFVKTNFVIEKL